MIYIGMTESNLTPSEVDLPASLEGLLFVSPGPVALTQLATFLGKSVTDIENSLHALEEVYRQKRGLCLQWQDGCVQLTTSPLLGELVEKYLGLEVTSRLSRAALEALAIIAYQQPMTRPQVDAIRGVNSDGVIKNLLGKGLIQERGRSEGLADPLCMARPLIFCNTWFTFNRSLAHFGFNCRIYGDHIKRSRNIKRISNG